MMTDLDYKPMREADCLTEIAAGESAFGLLFERMPQARRRFNAIDRSLQSLLADVREYFPDAEYYTASGGFNLMLGKPHDKPNGKPQSQLIAFAGQATIGDGDF